MRGLWRQSEDLGRPDRSHFFICSRSHLSNLAGGLKPSTVQVMAPGPPYAETHRPQLAAIGLIALDVPRQLWLPMGLISVRDSSVL